MSSAAAALAPPAPVDGTRGPTRSFSTSGDGKNLMFVSLYLRCELTDDIDAPVKKYLTRSKCCA